MHRLTEEQKAPRRGRKTRARQYTSKKWKKGVNRRFKFEFADEQDFDLVKLCKLREDVKPIVYSPLSVVDEDPVTKTIHYIPRTAKSVTATKSYMRPTVARLNKSTARSNKAFSDYKYDEEDSADSEQLFKIDKDLIKQNLAANISMHQTNNSSRRGSRVRG